MAHRRCACWNALRSSAGLPTRFPRTDRCRVSPGDSSRERTCRIPARRGHRRGPRVERRAAADARQLRSRNAVGRMTMFNADPDQEHEHAVHCAACGHQRGVHDDSMKLRMGTVHPAEDAWARVRGLTRHPPTTSPSAIQVRILIRIRDCLSVGNAAWDAVEPAEPRSLRERRWVLRVRQPARCVEGGPRCPEQTSSVAASRYATVRPTRASW